MGLVLHATGAFPLASVGVFLLAILVGGVPVLRHAYQEVAIARSLGINSLMVIAVIGAMAIRGGRRLPLSSCCSRSERRWRDLRQNEPGARSKPCWTLRHLWPSNSIAEVNGSKCRLAISHRVITSWCVPAIVWGRMGSCRPVTPRWTRLRSRGRAFRLTRLRAMPSMRVPSTLSVPLKIEVTRRAADNTLSQMVALVREASHARHPSSVSSIALPESTRPLWPLWLSFWPRFPLFCLPSRSWEDRGWLMRALQMLVITCPCALVISTPVTVVSALTHAAGRGVLVKGAHTLSGVLTLWRLTRRVPLPQGIPRSRTS